ncbi:Uncharacterised protein [Burkholderia pseudomallei]|nr:hypothetical protein DO65_1420 [Burkholderia pseudomallei]CAJ3348512.1 Uncharacterised protein [Burkholderia pseudomallei]CAJ3494623.1 Uncharacterised protein [Burkholderia pseudomallei]CAJ3514490.1 Uncharacterised protein [Burkholderia pseudomallei]CAJ3564678.1 Uncharacterised protein [Burkholderia pseudomallei]
MKLTARASARSPLRAVSAAWLIAMKLPQRIGCESWPKNSSSSARAIAFHSAPYCRADTRAFGCASSAPAMPACARSEASSTPRRRDSARLDSTSSIETVPFFSSCFIAGARCGAVWQKRSV